MYKRQARWCCNKVVLPSAWSESVRWGWESDYKESERVIEMFRLNRGYEGLVKGLKFERVNYTKDLPVAVNVDDYFDDTTVGNKHRCV